MKPLVTVVIPCLNEERYIERCIRSVERQEYPRECLEVVVADGDSDDGTRPLLEAMQHTWSSLRVVNNPRRYTPVAMNLGIAEARGSVIIILGAHAELSPGFVARCVALLDRFPEAGCVGGLIENVHENHTAAVVSRAMQSPFGVGNARFRTGGKAGFVDTVAFGAYRTEALKQLGGFDEQLVRNQDDELNFRLIRAGYLIYFDPKIRSKYYVRSSFKKLFRQYFQYGYWKVYVNRKHRTVTTWRQLVPFAWVSWLALGIVATLLNRHWAPLLTLPLLLWFLAALAAGLYAATPSRDLPALIRTFFTLHLGYGAGYARGIYDFVLLRREPSPSEHTLTR